MIGLVPPDRVAAAEKAVAAGMDRRAFDEALKRLAILDPIDCTALRGHILALRITAQDLLRLLDDPRALQRALVARKAVARRLIDAAAAGEPLPLSVRHAYGCCSRYHVEALIAAVREGSFTWEDAVECAYATPLLALHLDSRVSVPISFASSIGRSESRRNRSGERVIFEETVNVRSDRGSFDLLVSGEIEFWRAATFSTKEPETVRWLEETVKDDTVFYDVGANIGLFSLYVAILSPKARSIAFEPHPLTLAQLTRNVHHNHFGHRIRIYPVALGSRDEVLTFSIRDFCAGEASPQSRDHGFAVGCTAMRLDHFIRRAGAPCPTHLKIDVDGPQRAVLEGAAATLAAPQLRHVLVEAREDEIEPVARQMASLGLQQRSKHRHSRTIGAGGDVFNVIFEKDALA